MKQILLLTDFSDNAYNAIRYAMHFFKSEVCNFHLMNVHKVNSYISDDLMTSSKESIYESITKRPKAEIDKLIADLTQEFNNDKHTFNVVIDFDVFIDAVKQAVKNKSIDYLVMGTNGATGAKEVLLGSNTRNVIRKVNCKAIIVPENYIFKPIKELLLVLDPKDELNGNTFTELLEFLETYQLHLHVLRIHPNQETSENEFNDKSNLALIKCEYRLINNVPIDQAVSQYLEVNSIDFTAIIIHKEGFFEHLFTNASTSKMDISKINKPIIVLHAH